MSIIDLFKIKVDSIISFPLQPSESHSKDYCKKVIYILKDAICDNQILFAQYAYLASTRHQALKEEFNGLKRLEKLSEYRNELEGHLDSQLKEAFKINFKYIKDYFKLRLKSDESGNPSVKRGLAFRLPSVVQHHEWRWRSDIAAENSAAER
jgi:hypothetical protein